MEERLALYVYHDQYYGGIVSNVPPLKKARAVGDPQRKNTTRVPSRTVGESWDACTREEIELDTADLPREVISRKPWATKRVELFETFGINVPEKGHITITVHLPE